jgi:GDPmannose 4,6-dehydratase
MRLMLAAPAADDYILATGRACSVREFASAAFGELGLELAFEGQGTAELARRKDTGAVVLRVDPKFYRPVESATLVGDAAHAKTKLGWIPRTVGGDVARQMARADYAALTS